MAAKIVKDYPLGQYKDKPPTPFLEAYPEWLKENVGIDPSELDSETAFAEGVRLGLACHKPYQTSDFNRARTAEARAAREAELEERRALAEERAARKAEKDEERAAKLAEREAARAAKQARADEKAAANPPAKKAAAKVPAAKVPAAKKAPVRRKGATEAAF